MKIGTWKKTLENDAGDYYVYQNAAGYEVKIFRAAEGSSSNPKWSWKVEFRDVKNIEYLGGTAAESKKLAFMEANKFMKKHSRKKSPEKKLDIHGNPVSDSRGKHWNKKLGRFVYT